MGDLAINCNNNLKTIRDNWNNKLKVLGLTGVRLKLSKGKLIADGFINEMNINNKTDIVIPNNINNISNNILNKFNYKKLVLPNSLNSLANIQLDNAKFQELVLGKNIKSIPPYFCNCNEYLTKVDFSNVEKIKEKAFFNCSYISELVFPESIKEIHSSAFDKCHRLLSVNFNEKLEYIGQCAFRSTNIGKVDLSKCNKISIGSNAFQHIFKLEEVILPNSLKIISDYTFDNCMNLKKINFPKELEYIGFGAFTNANKLQSVKLYNKLKTIESQAFYSCHNLRCIDLSECNELEIIKKDAFIFCRNLKQVILPKHQFKLEDESILSCLKGQQLSQKK